MADPPPQHPRSGVGGAAADPSLLDSQFFSGCLLQSLLLRLSSEGRLFCEACCLTLSGQGTSSLRQLSRVNTTFPDRLRGLFHAFALSRECGRSSGTVQLAPQLPSPRAAASTFRPSRSLLLVRLARRIKLLLGKTLNFLLIEKVYTPIPIPFCIGKLCHIKLLDPTENSGFTMKIGLSNILGFGLYFSTPQ